ncbi:MAG: hypothetical protein KY429_08915 [Actinobacteria bacterium]|nr:hypothetical protein [Actinomycetota bacterium]
MAKAQEEIKILSTKQVAEKLGTDPRTLRKFLRSRDRGVGTGSRYEFKPEQIATIKKQFTDWSKGEVKKKEPAATN